MDLPVEELRILVLEDVPTDAELEESALRDAGVVFTALRVDTREAFERALDEFRPDIVLADYRLPAYNGRDALEYTRRTHPWVPVIMVTGELGDEAAVELLKLGARDYVLKDRPARLAPALRRALSEERGIRNRKLAEGKYRALFNEAMDGIALLDCETGRVMDCNAEFERQTGRTREQLLETEVWALLPPEMRDTGRQHFEEIIAHDSGRSDALAFRRPDGTTIPIDYTAHMLHIQDKCFVQVIVRDISARRRAEHTLRRTHRALRTLSAANQALVKAVDIPQLLDAVCGTIVDEGEHGMAWVGYVTDDEANRIVPMACRGVDMGALAALRFTCANACMPAIVVQTGTMRIGRDILSDPDYAAFHGLAGAQGWNANLTVPLSDGTRVFGILSIFSADPAAFGPDEVALLTELAEDLAYGIGALRTRAERDQAAESNRRHLDQIRANLEATIQAIAATVEMRDPYTAGHEKRVAELSVAIGREMGLAEDRLDSLRIAANVHDVGKVKVPAEILSKPAALDDLEYSLIKIHPESGYRILKGIDFPWPIATIVRQHHERLDGSGYPQGLKNGDILLEAQILAVADVVEAAGSHRPYRPARSPAVALQEITNNRGRLYNAEAVDACVRLIREKKFLLS
jgi:PAS domain S-box-containing protein